jgi:hypothetical protein
MTAEEFTRQLLIAHANQLHAAKFTHQMHGQDILVGAICALEKLFELLIETCPDPRTATGLADQIANTVLAAAMKEKQ